jgi:hypothetical protein
MSSALRGAAGSGMTCLSSPLKASEMASTLSARDDRDRWHSCCCRCTRSRLLNCANPCKSHVFLSAIVIPSACSIPQAQSVHKPAPPHHQQGSFVGSLQASHGAAPAWGPWWLLTFQACALPASSPESLSVEYEFKKPHQGHEYQDRTLALKLPATTQSTRNQDCPSLRLTDSQSSLLRMQRPG